MASTVASAARSQEVRTLDTIRPEMAKAVLSSDRVGLGRFLSRFVVAQSGCWEWTGRLNGSGYGAFTVGSIEGAHRVSYSWFVAQIPVGLEIDHLCRNKRCVNPLHLEAVTKSENQLRAIAARGCCRNGHPLSPDTTRVWSVGGGRSARYCLTCKRASNAKARGKHVGA